MSREYLNGANNIMQFPNFDLKNAADLKTCWKTADGIDRTTNRTRVIINGKWRVECRRAGHCE